MCPDLFRFDLCRWYCLEATRLRIGYAHSPNAQSPFSHMVHFMVINPMKGLKGLHSMYCGQSLNRSLQRIPWRPSIRTKGMMVQRIMCPLWKISNKLRTDMKFNPIQGLVCVLKGKNAPETFAWIRISIACVNGRRTSLGDSPFPRTISKIFSTRTTFVQICKIMSNLHGRWNGDFHSII